MRDWPAPLLQPRQDTGCIEHSVAYLAHCLGFPHVTPQMVSDAKGAESPACERYLSQVLGWPQDTFWQYYKVPGYEDDVERRRFWLGPDARAWVEQRVASGQVGLVTVERVPDRAHAIALLETRGDAGVYVMDPLYGHRVDTWDWFLGVGAGRMGAHHVSGWFPLTR